MIDERVQNICRIDLQLQPQNEPCQAPVGFHRHLDIVRSLRDAGTTILYSTHYMEEAEQLCDRIAIMDDGRIVALGTLEELLRLRLEEIVVDERA